MAAISIQHLSKSFGQNRILDDISLEIKDGELFLLLGPSGCGKTTLLRSIAGLEIPDAGKIFFDSDEVTDLSANKRRIGMVFQSYALWPHMTVSQNIEFGLKVSRLSRAERESRIKEVTQLVRLSEFGDRYPSELSGGQQQRVALARALALRPKVLLLDEPLSNLDSELRLEIREEIRRLHKSLGLTMLMVTHDQSEALDLAERISILNAGRIIQTGTPQDIVHSPASAEVKKFIGEYNLLQGTMSGHHTVQVVKGDLSTHSDLTHRGMKTGQAVSCAVKPDSIIVFPETK